MSQNQPRLETVTIRGDILISLFSAIMERKYAACPMEAKDGCQAKATTCDAYFEPSTDHIHRTEG